MKTTSTSASCWLECSAACDVPNRRACRLRLQEYKRMPCPKVSCVLFCLLFSGSRFAPIHAFVQRFSPPTCLCCSKEAEDQRRGSTLPISTQCKEADCPTSGWGQVSLPKQHMQPSCIDQVASSKQERDMLGWHAGICSTVGCSSIKVLEKIHLRTQTCLLVIKFQGMQPRSPF